MATASTDSSSTTGDDGGLAPILLTITLHLENHSPYDDAYAASLLAFADAFAAHGGKLTFEPRREVIMTGSPAVLAAFASLEADGHAVGSHAAIGAAEGLGQAQFAMQLQAGRDELLGVVERVDHVSGICSPLDFVGAAATAGYSYTTAATVYCLLAMAPEDRPPEYEDLVCQSAIDPTCHRSYPDSAQGRMRPWRAADGAHWLTDDPAGAIVMLPGAGTLPCLAEERGGGMPSNCMLEADDLDLAFAELDEAIGLRDADGFFTWYWIWGSWDPDAASPEMLDAFLDGIDTRVAAGTVAWASSAEMYDGYLAWRGG